jgi:hydroxyacylglutathione hydrolase
VTPPPNLLFQQIKIGPMDNYVYFIGDCDSRKVGIVDPGWDIPRLEREAKKLQAQITCVLLTHGHPDHINGVEELSSRHDIKVLLSEKEAEYYTPDWPNIQRISDGEVISIGKTPINCLWTPGHSPGGMCFQCGDILITGDTLFVDAIGRCDLPGGDPQAMYHTLFQKILKLPDTTIVYPGHAYGPTSHATLASQKKTNSYLRCQSLDEFLNICIC